MSLKFVATGDTIVTCPYTRNYAGYQELVDFIRSHETKGEKETEPDYFAETFSRYCIDWGADAVVCSGTIGLFTQSCAFRCIAPVIEWDDDGNILKATALPLGLDFNDPKETKGFPRIANHEETELLYQQLKSTCEAYGTKVTIDEDGLFVFTPIGEGA